MTLAYKGYFLDSVKYGTDDFNSVFAHLISSGVSTFNGTTIADVADEISNATSSGVDIVEQDSCMVKKYGDSYKVSPGTCWLPDGSFIIVDSDGVQITPAEGEVNYVYVFHNVVTNEININVSSEKGDTDSVSLATIGTDGSVTDTRKFATAKVKLAANQSNMYTSKNLTVPYIGNASDETERLVDTVTVNHSFNYIYLEAVGRYYTYTSVVDNADTKYVDLDFAFGGTTTVTASLIFRITGSTVRIYVSRGAVYSNIKVTFM